jgi:hypothetical protein
MSTLQRSKHATVGLILLAHLSSCAARQPKGFIAGAKGRSLGLVGVTGLPRAPESALDVGPRGALAGAAVGAGKGATWLAVSVPCSGQDCLGVAVVMAGAVVGGAVVGGIMGAMKAVPAETADKIQSQLDAALGAVELQDSLRPAVAADAAQAGVENVREIGSAGPSDAGGSANQEATPPPEVDTTLEVGVSQVGFVGSGGADPDMTLHVLGVARLVDVRSGVELYRNADLAYVSDTRTFSQWSADDGRPLRDEIRHAGDVLAATIVDEVWPSGACGSRRVLTCGAPRLWRPRA